MKQKQIYELNPRLRFPEFREDGEWQKKTVGDVATIRSGTTPLRSESKFYKGGTIPWVKTTDLTNSFILHTEESITQNAKARINPAHSVLVAMYGGFNQIGRTGYLKLPAATNQAISVLNANRDEIIPVYLLMWLNAKVKYWEGIASSSRKDPNITSADVARFPITYPGTHEQKKIAECLTSIDELIIAYSRNIDALKAHKRGLMQQLFPAKGETVPRLRFPEFEKTGEWQKKKISVVLIEVSRPIEMKDDDEYSLVIVKRRYEGVISRGNLKGKEIKVKSQFLLQKDDFLISKRQIVHCACGLVPEEFEDSIVSNEYSILRARKELHIAFFHYFSQQPSVSKSFLECSDGIVIEKMLFKLDDWLKREFLFPTVEEQKKIAGVLFSIDERIASQGRKIEVLKAHKRGLMQQLFPPTYEAEG